MPSIPLSPKPPGTRMPSTSPSVSSTFSGVTSSESTHLISTSASFATPACFKDSTTEIYASCSETYLPTRATRTFFSGFFQAVIISFHSFHACGSGAGQSMCKHLHTTSARCSFSIARGTSYNTSTSRFWITFWLGTLQNSAILSFKP